MGQPSPISQTYGSGSIAIDSQLQPARPGLLRMILIISKPTPGLLRMILIIGNLLQMRIALNSVIENESQLQQPRPKPPRGSLSKTLSRALLKNFKTRYKL